MAGPVGRRQSYNCNLGTRDDLTGLENSLSVALSTFSLAGWPTELAGPAGQPMFVLVYCAAVSGSEMDCDGVACFPGFGPVLGCRYVVK